MRKKLKTVTAILLSAALQYCSASPIFALTENKTFTITLDDKEINLNQPLTIEDGIPFIPFRNFMEEVGASISWDENTKTITCTKDNKTIRVTIGASEINVNGKKVHIEFPAKIMDGKTLGPLQVINEALGMVIHYDFDTKTIIINTLKSIVKETSFDITDGETVLITAKIHTNSELLKEKLSEKAYSVFDERKISQAEEFLNKKINDLNTSLDNLKKEAKAIFLENMENFNPYEFTLTYDADEFDNYLSIISTEMTYTGGAHPSTLKSVQTYDMETGLVTLDEVAKKLCGKDSETILKEAKELFKKEIKENPDNFYDDSEKLVEDLSSDNFYISKDGIVFFFNQYEIAPYSSGIIEVKIPFEK